jgi:hypothetical protein
MTEQECIAELERIAYALDNSCSLREARALRDEREVWVRRRNEARAVEYARTKSTRTQLVLLLDARVEALWRPCDSCGDHMETEHAWPHEIVCEACDGVSMGHVQDFFDGMERDGRRRENQANRGE